MEKLPDGTAGFDGSAEKLKTASIVVALLCVMARSRRVKP